jgi:RimJ/RimL family protein N-acetyltransferase
LVPSAAQPAAEAVDVILRDGGTLRLRPPTGADAAALVDFFRRLSEQSLYLCFHGLRAVEAGLVEPFLDPDWSERGALVGSLAGEGDGNGVVAVANYVRLRDPSRAEIAFAVADSEQGRGIGTRLLE